MRTRRQAVLVLAALAVVALSFSVPAATAGGGSKGTASTDKVDINTAGVEELQTLPGIGPALAQRIVEHRREHGAFRRIEDLLEVKGIGEKSLERLRPRLKVSKADER